MNVILLAPTPPPYGGIAVWTDRMKRARLKNGWEIKVVDEKIIGDRTAYKFKYSNLNNEIKRHKRIWRDLKNELRDTDSVIVQACIPAGSRSMLREIISAKIARKRGRFFVVHFRCTLPNMLNSRMSKFIFRLLLKNTDYVFVLNQKSADFIKEYTNNYSIIPNFIESRDKYLRRSYSKTISRILYVGGVLESKGCNDLIEAAKSFPDKEFRLVGKVGIDTHNIPKNVKLLGEHDQFSIKKELINADVFVFLSHYTGEGFSNALAEAMSYSLPCIVTDWAANNDMIENKGGIVLRGDVVKGTVRAIKKLEGCEIRQKMGQWNYDKVRRCYTDKTVLGMYVDNYEKLINNKGRSL